MIIMNAQVVAIDGKKGAEMALPAQFAEAYRPDLIRRAFLSERSFTYQPKGNYPMAGRNYTAEYYGRRHAWRQTINTGRSRLPRVKIPGGRSGRVLTVPHATHGTRAHPPKANKILKERINIKEKNYAIRSAIAATGVKELVEKRGHKFEQAIAFPIIADTALEGIKKAKDAKAAFVAFGFEQDIERAHDARTMRSGRARLRRGGYRTPSSVLVVIGKDSGIWKAARNLPGVDVVSVEKLTVELLCPGGEAGRLTVWTKDAVEKLSAENLFM